MVSTGTGSALLQVSAGSATALLLVWSATGSGLALLLVCSATGLLCYWSATVLLLVCSATGLLLFCYWSLAWSENNDFSPKCSALYTYMITNQSHIINKF